MRGNRGHSNRPVLSYVKKAPHHMVANEIFLWGLILWNNVISCFIVPLFITFLCVHRGGSRIPRRRGRQHMILPNFAKNCMKLSKFWAVEGGGCIRHWHITFQQHLQELVMLLSGSRVMATHITLRNMYKGQLEPRSWPHTHTVPRWIHSPC